jgi:hypothetical protein
MNKLILAIVIGLGLASASYANTMYAVGVGFSVDASSLDAINQATSSYNLLGDTHGPNPANSLPASLGTVNLNEGGLLQLANASAKTWQGSTDSANAVTLFWRVYETGAADKGSYASYNVPFSNSWNPDGNVNKYWLANTSVNLLQNVTAGTVELPKVYTIEMYAKADFTWSNGGSSGSFESFASNGDVNYTTQFTAVPEPSILSMLGIGGLLLLRKRK